MSEFPTSIQNYSNIHKYSMGEGQGLAEDLGKILEKYLWRSSFVKVPDCKAKPTWSSV